MGTKRSINNVRKETEEGLPVPPGFVSLTSFTLKRIKRQTANGIPKSICAPLSDSDIEKFKASDSLAQEFDTKQTEVEKTASNDPRKEGDIRRQRSGSRDSNAPRRRSISSSVSNTPMGSRRDDDLLRQNMTSLLEQQGVYRVSTDGMFPDYRPINFPSHLNISNASTTPNLSNQHNFNPFYFNDQNSYTNPWNTTNTMNPPSSFPAGRSTPSRLTVPFSTRVSRPAPKRDPPSGQPLRHDPSLPAHPPTVRDTENMDVAVPQKSKGRTQTKASSEIAVAAKRMEITIALKRKNFVQPEPGKDISALLRLHYKGDFLWDCLSAETRSFLWEQFGMRYRWEKRIETDIYFVWEALNRKYFVQMLERAKRLWKLKNEKAKWLVPKYYRRLVKYWMSDEQQRIAARHATNRGSDPTYFGGSVRMMQYQSMLDKQDEGNEADKYSEVVSPSVFKATKAKNCKTLLKSLFGGKKKHNVDHVEESVTETEAEPENESGQVTEPEWGDTKWQESMFRYWEEVEEKYREYPNMKPEENDPLDMECWTKACKGPKNGRILGLGGDLKINEFGVGRTHRPQSRPDSQPSNKEIMQQYYNVLMTQPGLDDATRESLAARLREVDEHLRKGKTPVESSSRRGARDSENDSDSD